MSVDQLFGGRLFGAANWISNLFSSGGTSKISAAKDPNQKLGPAGFGEAGYIKPEGSFAYRVDFENDPDATAPAQVVTISDQLHLNLDWSSFELTEIGFGDHLIPVPAQTRQFEYTEPMSVDGNDIEVQIRFQLNLQTGELNALFASIDPATGLPPPVTVGFLPPDDGTGRGQGHFGYLIRSRAGLVTGDEIRNIANITFDFGETIATNQVDPHDPSQGTDPAKEAPNTIDAEGPTSAVNTLPATSDLTFEVSWSGDDGIGSGVAHYTIYVQENGGAFAQWLVNTPATSDQFTGSQASVYGFYSIATDNVGHVEPPKTVAESTTAIDALDTDGDGLPDAIDPDDDNDGVDDEDDLLPLDPNVGANDCSEYDEIIEDRTFDYGESYACQAPGSIIAQGAVTVGDGAYVYLEAPNVRLDSVFRVAQEGVLRVAVPSSTAFTNTQIAGQPVGANESADAGKKPGLERTQSAAVGGSGIPQRLTRDQLPAGLVQRLRNIGATVTDASSDASGRYVVLATDGPLVDCDRNGVSDVYWYDQLDDWLTLVSAGVEGWAGSGPSTRPRMDRDGTMVVYQSEAGNLIVGDGNGVSDIFRYDPVTGFTERVSWTLESGESAAGSAHPALDAAGTQILYDRFRTEGFRQIFGYEPQEFATELVSLVEDPEDGQALDNHHPGISPDGRYVVYLEGKPANAFEPARCAVHFYDQEDGLYARVPCPREISGASEYTPFFSADAASVEWVEDSEPFGLGTDQPPQSTVVVENPLLGY